MATCPGAGVRRYVAQCGREPARDCGPWARQSRTGWHVSDRCFHWDCTVGVQTSISDRFSSVGKARAHEMNPRRICKTKKKLLQLWKWKWACFHTCIRNASRVDLTMNKWPRRPGCEQGWMIGRSFLILWVPYMQLSNPGGHFTPLIFFGNSRRFGYLKWTKNLFKPKQENRYVDTMQKS